EVAEHASFKNYDSVILPISGNSKSWVASRIRKEILNGLNERLMVIEIGLQDNVYDIDLSERGSVDKRVSTVFDEGLRGVMDIGPRVP
ncbi:MAG TPA: hypothetical protein VIF12_06180, partial [Micavibrio sp.]